MTFFQQLGILAALEADQKARDERATAPPDRPTVDEAYTPLIRLARWLDRVAAWLRRAK